MTKYLSENLDVDLFSHRYWYKEAVQLSDKLHLFNIKFYQEFDGVDILCQKLTLLAWGAF